MKAKTDYTKILKPDPLRPVDGYRYRNGHKFECMAIGEYGKWPIVTRDVINKYVYSHAKDGSLWHSGSTDPQDIVPFDETGNQSEK